MNEQQEEFVPLITVWQKLILSVSSPSLPGGNFTVINCTGFPDLHLLFSSPWAEWDNLDRTRIWKSPSSWTAAILSMLEN